MVLKVVASLMLCGAAFLSGATELDLSELMPAEPKTPARAPSVLEKGYAAPTNVVAEVSNVVETVVAADTVTNVVEAATNAVEEAAAPTAEVVVEHIVSTNEASAAKVRTSRPARITSATTYYDRKEGVIFFDKNVYVDDEQYQLHADRAYVFISGTNDLRRIVAVGNVSLTNDLRRAYGSKVSYYKEGGMVVLYGSAERPAEVRDETKSEPQVVKGSKIKFWINSEQVEVIDADISAPVSGASSDFKQAIRRTK